MQATSDKDDSIVSSVLDKIRTEFNSELQSLTQRTCTLTSKGEASRTSPAAITDTDLSSPLPFLLPYTTPWLYASLLSRIAEYLETRGEYERANEVLASLLAQEVVCTGSRGRWWERLALNSDYHLKDKVKVSNCRTL